MSRHFVFTAYQEEKIGLADWMTYIIAGREKCPTTGRMHWQGHLITQRKMRVNAVRELMKPHYLDVSRSPVDSRRYCKEDGQWYEEGTWSFHGQRTDLEGVVKQIMNQEIKLDEIIVENPMLYHQYGRTLEKAADLVLKRLKRDWMPVCKWIWGPTGTGKTRSVVEKEKSLYFFPYEKNGWWDNYEGQEAVLFDDFRGQLPMNEVLRICDRYDYTVPRRGRQPIPLLAKRIYFTCCKVPEEVFKDNESITQLLRRVEVVYKDGLHEEEEEKKED